MSDLVTCEDGKTRCNFRVNDPIFTHYHDTTFGRPTTDDIYIFRKICFEIFASGLSFHGVLTKAAIFDEAYNNFDMNLVAAYGDADVERLMQDARLVRNKVKITAVINNARCALGLVDKFGSLAAFLWQYEPDPATRPDPVTAETLRTNTQSVYSERLARDLKAHGFKFVGPVSMYGVLQGCGLINDHFEGCDFRAPCAAERAVFTVPQPPVNAS
ncbi:DNA-3-methyladenine glycosylase I [uncultured Tateyamaria sp.]|uniref:DNA-3-methyladenine glycosylase I n=1 Tax=uncultured Tateyamaria sp. TaxID=455651 RepID=UPI00262CC562|nr:DNA-3-methyladenine glycosylase I [uncultured Tateyamaria sp.]